MIITMIVFKNIKGTLWAVPHMGQKYCQQDTTDTPKGPFKTYVTHLGGGRLGRKMAKCDISSRRN